MPWLHRYVGNPVLTGVLNVFFRTGVRDAHCGMRALRRDVLPRLDLRTTGMEFASEMVIRASKEKLDIREFPIEYHPRGGESKLSSFRDGWRHLRFLLVHSPTHLFMLPGAIMLAVGALIALISLLQINVFGREWELHTMLGGALLMIVGVQVVALGLCRARVRHVLHEREGPLVRPDAGALQARARARRWAARSCWSASLIGAVIVVTWINRGFGELSEERLAVLAATLVIVGIQVFFTSFLLSILGLRRRA